MFDTMSDEELILATKRATHKLYNFEAAEGGAWYAERAARDSHRVYWGELIEECNARGIPREAYKVGFFDPPV